MTKICISIVHYNNPSATLACLDSLKTIDIKNIDLQIVVIDNASKDKLRLEKNDYPSVFTIVNEKNLGFTGGHNTGITYALQQGAEYVVILNNDTTVHASFLQSLLETYQSNTDVGIVCPKIYYSPGSEYHKDRYTKNQLGKVIWYAGGFIDYNNISGKHIGVDEVDLGKYDQSTITEFATGCCMMVKSSVFEKIGMFDDKYFLYYEDADFTERVKKAGLKIYYCSKSLIWHQNAVSTGGSGSKLQDYYISRNRLLFGMRYGSLRLRLALLKESFAVYRKGRKWQKVGIKDYYLKHFGKGSYITSDK